MQKRAKRFGSPADRRKRKQIAVNRAKHTEAERDRERDAARKRISRSAGREIEIPAVLHPRRKRSCVRDLERFLKIYMARSFYLDFSEDHRKVIRKMQLAILEGGNFCVAMPRSYGKTTLCEGAILWAIGYGHRKYIVPLASTTDLASEMLADVVAELEGNDVLLEDFPELCAPFRELEGMVLRCAGQRYRGKRTGIQRKRDRLVCAEIPAAKCGGAVIRPKGLDAAVRGLKHKGLDGVPRRPDFVLPDDPQTDESAASHKQCLDREKRIQGAVLGLAGPKKKIAAVMACTVIRRGDLSDRMLDATLHPDWQGERLKLVYRWATEQKTLWGEYAQLRREGMAAGDQGKGATAFYAAHRSEMDEGAMISWIPFFDADELSALQHAQNLLIDRGAEVFHAEYQNDPLPDEAAQYEITPETICKKTNGLKRREIPSGCQWLVGMIDINYSGLRWAAVAFQNNAAGYIVDYGKFPAAENEVLFDPKGRTGLSDKQAIYGGLANLLPTVLALNFTRADAPKAFDLFLIDCGFWMDTVFEFVARTKTDLGPRLVPSRGRASQKYRQTGTIGRAGDHHHLTVFAGRGNVIVHDSDYWRMRAQKAFLLPVGAAGSLSLWGGSGEGHRHATFARQVAAEQLVEFVRGDTADFFRWTMQPGDTNDFGDALVGCCVAGSTCGASSHFKADVEAAAAARQRPARQREMRHYDL